MTYFQLHSTFEQNGTETNHTQAVYLFVSDYGSDWYNTHQFTEINLRDSDISDW